MGAVAELIDGQLAPAGSLPTFFQEDVKKLQPVS